MVRSAARFALIVGLATLSAPLDAADIERVAPARDLLLYGSGDDLDHSCTLRLSGEIAAGDSETLASMAAQYGTSDVLCLSGPGGSYTEGIALARLIHERAILTRVGADETCVSACAIAFLGGNYNSASGLGNFVGRYIDVTSRLGFHRPFIVPGEGTYTAAEVKASFDLASTTIRDLISVADTFSLPPHLIAAMLAHGSSSYEWIDTIDELGYYKIGLTGYARPAVDRAAVLSGCWNAYLWNQNVPVSALFADAAEQQSELDQTEWPVTAGATGGTAVFMPGDWEEHCAVEVAVARNEYAWNAEIATFRFGSSSNAPPERTYDYPLWSLWPAATRLADIPPGDRSDLRFRFSRSALLGQ